MTAYGRKGFGPRELLAACLFAAFCAACNGGGNGGGAGVAEPTPTPTAGRNSVTRSNPNGTTTLVVEKLEFSAGDEVGFRVLLRNADGGPVVGESVRIVAGGGLVVLSPQGGVGETDAEGVLRGTIGAVAGGAFQVQAIPQSAELGLPVASLNVLVFGAGATPTPTGGGPGGPAPTQTPTAAPVARVASIIVQASPFSISSATGGTVDVTAFAFDENNVPVPGVRLLFDADPRVGTSFDPRTPVTDENGQARSVLTISPGAAVGSLVITASGGVIQGSITIQVVSGASQKPVAIVVLETDQPVIGTDSGGTASLRARVLDADNVGIPDVNVLFRTQVGEVNPAVAVTCGGEENPCPPSEVGVAQSTLIVPPNAVVKEYTLEAVAGGVTGSTTLFVVPGRGGTGTGNPNAAEGEPASMSLGASPTQIQVRETGGTELSTVVVRLFDNNNNPLANRTVALRVLGDDPNGAHMLPLTGGNPVLPEACLQDAGRQRALDEGRLALGVSDRAGFVLAALRSGTVSGTVTVEACVDSKNFDGTTVTIVERQPVVTVAAGPPELVSVAVNPAFVNNNDGTLLTTVAALVKDRYGNTVEDGTAVFFSITNRTDVSIVGSSVTNNDPPCDVSQFPQQTGLPVTPQPGTAITCVIYPAAQAGTIVRIRAESGGVTNEDNDVDDEEFALPPGSLTGPATGVPSARSFSLAADLLNISGRVSFGLTSTITAFVADRFGNPVSANTLVRFATDGGGVTSQNTTDLLGRTAALLTSQSPIPPSGIATVTASVLGEEDFVDVDGDGVFDEGTDVFDPVLHDQDGNGVWSPSTTIRSSIGVIFSGPTQFSVTVDPPSQDPRFDFEVVGGFPTCIDVHVSDDLDNPIVGGSVVSVVLSENLQILGPSAYSVVDTNDPCRFVPQACDFRFCFTARDQVDSDQASAVTVVVQSRELPGGGNGDVAGALGGVIRAPTPTPQPTTTPTPTPTPTQAES
ncbi:MAG: hypothetical protein KatS3mg076_1003 [Candidatus Binatia bacterium]|nr:MAG: hypothetical protein KatS3mg076_1003 [Candidatus Binatia bacterium]